MPGLRYSHLVKVHKNEGDDFVVRNRDAVFPEHLVHILVDLGLKTDLLFFHFSEFK